MSSRASRVSSATLLQGKPLADRIEARSRERVAALRARGVTARLAVVSVGADASANAYLGRLTARGRRIGVPVDDVALRRDASMHDVVATLAQLSGDARTHGILLLTPLPPALEDARVVEHIAREKDVEGMNPINVGLLAAGRPRFIPSTAEAVIELLRFYDIALAGAHAVVVGRSMVVGRPASLLLLQHDATVTVAHSKTPDLPGLTRDADLVVVAVGRAGFIRGEMVKSGATVIDAGINVTPRGIVGDADTESVSLVAGALSPVPGGLGAVTTELLLRNVVSAAEQSET
jgi:methylenetetrahydrofolate dehydrogenase (NADP+)/methenyltetrahydrofolate cyclohydrolase